MANRLLLASGFGGGDGCMCVCMCIEQNWQYTFFIYNLMSDCVKRIWNYCVFLENVTCVTYVE